MKPLAVALRRAPGLRAAILLAFAAAAACADTPPASVGLDQRACSSDDDCTRRELCVEGFCVAMGDTPDTPDAATPDPDAATPDPDAATPDPDSGVEDADPAEPDADLSCGEGCPEGEVCSDGRCFCAEGATRVCGIKLGECRYGVANCTGGAWGACEGGVEPVEETCDRLDNDCDARVDEGIGQDIYADADGDGFGNPDVTFLACFPEEGQSEQAGDCDDAEQTTNPDAPEVCDGADNDCDSSVDEGCDCVVGTVEPCGLDLGRCRPGTRACAPEGWGACEDAVTAVPETCNGADDDCDGEIDEEDACAPPELTCPEPQVIALGETAPLRGGGIDPDGGELTFAWSVGASPEGAIARPEPPDAAEATFTPDALGAWAFQLCGTDDEAVEACCEAQVQVVSPCDPPPGPGLTACGVSWDRRPILEFHPLPDGMRYDFAIQETGAPVASVTTPGQNYLRPAAPIGLGGPLPGAPVTLSARTCRADSPTCCSEPEAAEVLLVEACTTPVAPTASNILISEYLINGDNGSGTPGPTFEAGESVEITNLSSCPITLEGVHLRYCSSAACTTVRYMNFGPDDIIPPRGVFVSIRAPQASTCGFDFLPEADNAEIFGIRRSSLELVPAGSATDNNGGWFGNNGTTGSLRLAQGAYATPRGGQTIIEVEPYLGNQNNCESVGFDALGACGETPAASIPTEELGDNQLGRLWHPCDAVVNPNPPTCFD